MQKHFVYFCVFIIFLATIETSCGGRDEEGEGRAEGEGVVFVRIGSMTSHTCTPGLSAGVSV